MAASDSAGSCVSAELVIDASRVTLRSPSFDRRLVAARLRSAQRSATSRKRHVTTGVRPLSRTTTPQERRHASSSSAAHLAAPASHGTGMTESTAISVRSAAKPTFHLSYSARCCAMLRRCGLDRSRSEPRACASAHAYGSLRLLRFARCDTRARARCTVNFGNFRGWPHEDRLRRRRSRRPLFRDLDEASRSGARDRDVRAQSRPA